MAVQHAQVFSGSVALEHLPHKESLHEYVVNCESPILH